MRSTIRLHAASLLPALAFATLAACGGGADGTDTATADTAGLAPAPMASDTGMMAPGTGAGSSAMLSDANTGAQIDSVVTAGRSGLTSLAPAVAVPLIRSLEDKLDNSNDPALTDIAKDLEKLREELEDDTPDGPDIASILERLGPKVTNAAGNAGAMAGTLRELGQQLTQAATQLRGTR